MERGEVAAEVDLLDDILVHDGASGEEIGTLHDSVADSLNVVE